MDWFNKIANTVIALLLGIAGMFYIPAAVDTIAAFGEIFATCLIGKVVTSPDLSVAGCIVFAGWIVFVIYAVWAMPENPQDHYDRYNR